MLSSLFDRLFAGTILRRLDALQAQGDLLLATIQDVNARLADIEVAIAEERAEVQALLTDLRTQIQVLQDQVGQGQLVTQEQLDELAESAEAIVERVRAISEPVAA